MSERDKLDKWFLDTIAYEMRGSNSQGAKAANIASLAIKFLNIQEGMLRKELEETINA